MGEVLVTRTELPDAFGYQWAVTFLNSEYYTGVVSSQLFNVPLLVLANTDNTPAARYPHPLPFYNPLLTPFYYCLSLTITLSL